MARRSPEEVAAKQRALEDKTLRENAAWRGSWLAGNDAPVRAGIEAVPRRVRNRRTTTTTTTSSCRASAAPVAQTGEMTGETETAAPADGSKPSVAPSGDDPDSDLPRLANAEPNTAPQLSELIRRAIGSGPTEPLSLKLQRQAAEPGLRAAEIVDWERVLDTQ